ncbi:hypothetical protein DOY81_012067 [Sarcophaga bullata]|nr:hypothetical protein DOY81_012067 [Sarcophaga bullata]
MLFGFWQLKTTVLALLLASCLGHELLRTCQRDYCSERSVERRNIEADNLRKLYGDNISRGLRENHLDQFNSESNREVRRELTTLAENRREIVRHEPSRRENHQNFVEVDNTRVTVDESDFNRRLEETPEIRRSIILQVERKQETNEDRFRTPISRLNERENRQERNELRDEYQESHRFNDRLSMRQLEVFQRSEEGQAEREISDLDRQSHRSSDRIIESKRNLLQRRERNLEERENREFPRSDDHITVRNPEAVQRRHQINEESSIINEVLTRNQHENNRDVARRETENLETRGFDERTSEKALEIRFENLRREPENDGNMDKSRRLSLTEGDLLDRYDSRLDERERSNYRSIEQLSERTRESIQRREVNLQERDNGLEEVRTSSSRHDLRERLTEQRENLKRLDKREALVENHHSMDQLSERRQEAMQRREINRHERAEFQRSNSRLSEQRETTRRLNEHENGRGGSEVAQHHIDMERERNVERNVRDNNNRRKNSYNDELKISKEENNSRQPAIIQKERRFEAYSSHGENRFDNLFERENILNRNRDIQRSIERRTESDEENFENRNENVNHMRSSARSEPHNIHRLADENLNSQRSEERRNENGLLNTISRRSSFSRNERESLEQRYIGGSEFTPRHEELLKLDERYNERNINRASDRSSTEIQRSRVRTFENVDNIRERDNQNLDKRNLQYDTNTDLETRRSNERRDRIESTRSNHQMILKKGETTKLQQRRDENKREQREERENERFETLSNRNGENRQDFQLIGDEYKETPTDSLKSSNMAYMQGVLLAFVIMKSLNGKNNIKCQISQKFQEAIAVLGF